MRIDNSNGAVRDHFRLPIGAEPGELPPIDLCFDCAWQLDGILGDDFYPNDHPSYDDDSYHCFICNAELNEGIDGHSIEIALNEKWGRK